MSPWSNRRLKTLWTAFSWKSSVVRMKRSYFTPSFSQVLMNWGVIRSTNSRGVMPSAAAAFSILTPCSSTPVRKKTSSPRSRW
ncbi:hypothetical protein D3C78_1651500 [compost metagenome]